MSLLLPQNIITRVPDWTSAVILDIESLSGGITNKSYRVKINNEYFVVRVCGENAEFLGISRNCEYAAASRAATIGIAPEIIYFSKLEGHMITRFINGRNLLLADMQHSENIRRVTQSIKKIHRLNINCGENYSPFEAVYKYNRILRKSKAVLPSNYDWILNQVEILEESDKLSFSMIGLCHNDLVRVNLFDDGSIRIIDWEYAGMGDVFFDLAALSVENNFSTANEHLLLETYFGQVRAEYYEKLTSMKLMWLVRDAMWSLVQHEISDILFDFRKFSQRRFEKFSEQLTKKL